MWVALSIETLVHLGHKEVQSGGQHLGRTDGGRDELCQQYAVFSQSKSKQKHKDTMKHKRREMWYNGFVTGLLDTNNKLHILQSNTKNNAAMSGHQI